MRVSNMNWQQVADYLAHDDRAVLPLGSTEQHAYLSLSVDSILSERVAVEAAIQQGWERFIGEDGAFVGMTGFGASAPAEVLYEKFGITAEAVVAAVKARL